MSTRFVSDPLDDLLLRADLSPEKVDQALERLARLWRPTILAPGHVYLRQIRERTGVRVVGIWRRYRRLLVQIEQIDDGRLAWQYFERGRTQCVFSCPGTISATLAVGLSGRQLRSLAIPTPALGTVSIDSVEQRGEWLNVPVTPSWRAF